MNCATCKVNKIGPKTIPYGGFLCSNEHLQCNDCNMLSHGQCGICEEATNFVQMNFNYCFNSLHDAETKFAMSAVGQAPSAPPLPSQASILSIGQLSACFSKNILAEIETQSNLSQEQLSMRDSKESLKQNNANKDVATNTAKENKTHEKSVKQTSAKNKQFTMDLANKKSFNKISNTMTEKQKLKNSIDQKPIMETIFIGTTPETNSASNFGYAFHNVNTGTINDGQVIKADNKKHHRQTNYNAPKESGLKENIFLFKEDPEDSHIIHTSEIRFMESTDSLQNFYSNGTALGAKTSLTEEMKHKHGPELTNDIKPEQEILSIKVLQNFETHNTANSTEIVQNYLRTFGPLAYYHFPGYNCHHTYCDFGWQQQQQQQQQLQQQQQMQNMVEHKKTVCVSKNSSSNLKNHDMQKSADIEVTLPAKFKPQDYVVMHSMGASKPEKDNEALTDKFGRPSLDMRMQKILETFQEDPKTQKIEEKPTKGNYIKIPTAEPKPLQSLTENHIAPIETQQNKSTSVPGIANTDSVVVLELLNSHRAYYNPSHQAEKPVSNLHTLAQPEPVSQEPPCSQFQTIPCSSSVVQELLMKKSRFLNNKPVPAYMLTISRTPIKCPDSTCQRMIFVSDFNKHLVVDHSHLHMERLTPFQCKNFFLDPRLAHSGISKCHLLYLMHDKISDLGSSKYKDFLPLLVMTSRISLTQMCGLKQDPRQAANEHLDFFIIWVTGIGPEEFPISVSLTVWPRSGKIPSCHVVYSGDMYSIRHSQQGLDVWQSGRMLLLSSQELDLLTNGGKEMLNLQLMVH